MWSQNVSHSSLKWIQEKQWIVGESLGKGSFGMVYQCMNEMGNLYAIKCIQINPECRNSMDDLMHEIKLMRNLDHPNIVKYIGASIDETIGQLYIVQEWASGGSIAQLLKRYGPFSESVVRNYTRQILHGLSYLHSHGIVHRDIKCSNILVDETGALKLADFGASIQVDLNGTVAMDNIKGTPFFMAPEVMFQNRYGRKGDIWAVGCTMIQMLTGEAPWRERNLQNMVKLQFLLASWPGGPPPVAVAYELSDDMKECLDLCFRLDFVIRPAAQELLTLSLFRETIVHMEEASQDIDSPLYVKCGISSSRSEARDDKGVDRGGALALLREQMVRVMQALNADDRTFECRVQSSKLPPSPTTTAASALSDQEYLLDVPSYVGGCRLRSESTVSAPSTPTPTTTPVRLSPLRCDIVPNVFNDARNTVARASKKLMPAVIPIAEGDEADSTCYPLSATTGATALHKIPLTPNNYRHRRRSDPVAPLVLPPVSQPRLARVHPRSTATQGRLSVPTQHPAQLARTTSLSSTANSSGRTGSDHDSSALSNDSSHSGSLHSVTSGSRRRSPHESSAGVSKSAPNTAPIIPTSQGSKSNKAKGYRSVSASASTVASPQASSWRAGSTRSTAIPPWPRPGLALRSVEQALQPVRAPRGYLRSASMV